MVDVLASASSSYDSAHSAPCVPDPGQSATVAEDVVENDVDDVEALRYLQQTHGPVLLKFLTRLTRGDVHRAEDIVQEALLRAWRNPEARHADGRWSRAYIFTVAKRIFVDQVRMAEVRPQELSDEHIGAHAWTEDPTERLLDRHEVRAALNALPERLRQTLVEIYFRDRPVSEVAEILNVPAGTVKSRTFYALRALREDLTGRGFHFRAREQAKEKDRKP